MCALRRRRLGKCVNPQFTGHITKQKGRTGVKGHRYGHDPDSGQERFRLAAAAAAAAAVGQ